MDGQHEGQYVLAGELFVLPTPAGAYHAVSTPDDSPVRRLLLALLRHRSSPRIDTRFLRESLGTDSEQEAPIEQGSEQANGE